MITPYCFIDRALQVGFKITLGCHKISHANSKVNIKPNFAELRFESRYNSKILKEIATVHATVINQCKYRNQTVVSATFDKHFEDGLMLDKIVL